MKRTGRLALLASLATCLVLALGALTGCSKGGSDTGGGDDPQPVASKAALTGSYINEFDGTLYYSTFSLSADEDVDIDGATHLPVPARNFVVRGDDLFYSEIPAGTALVSGNLYRTTLAGGEKEAKVLASDCDLWVPFYISGDKLIYHGLEDETTGSYACVIDLSSDDSEPVVLKRSNGHAVFVVGANQNRIFYSDNDDYETLYSAKFDMSSECEIYHGPRSTVFVNDEGNLCLIDSENKALKVIDESGNELQSIDTGIDPTYSVGSGNIAACVDNGLDVYRFDTTTGEQLQTINLAAGNMIWIMYFDDERVIYESYDTDAWSAGEANTTLYMHDIKGDGALECGRYFSS